ncbi:uncharacterized protein LOC144102478 [Amblyomma americanum]
MTNNWRCVTPSHKSAHSNVHFDCIASNGINPGAPAPPSHHGSHDSGPCGVTICGMSLDPGGTRLRALAVACFLVAGVHCGAVFTYGVPAAVVHAPVVHTPVMNQAVVRAPVVAEHKELVHAPHHEYGYTVEHNKLVHPKSTVVPHYPLTGLPYQQTDYHHAPVVTGSRSSVYHSRPGYVQERTRAYIY